jgi:hypothetical protein
MAGVGQEPRIIDNANPPASNLCALLIDATPFAGQQMVVALGISQDTDEAPGCLPAENVASPGGCELASEEISVRSQAPCYN